MRCEIHTVEALVRGVTPWGGEKGVWNWGWLLMRMVLVYGHLKSFASKLSLLRRMRFLPQKQLEDFYTKVILPSVTYGLTVWGSCNKTHLNNLEKLHARAGQIVYGLPWDTSAEDVLMWTGWDSLETMYKLRLTEFVFKCLKGYTITEFKDLFLQRNSGCRRNENIILPRPETNFIRNSIYALEEQSHGTL